MLNPAQVAQNHAKRVQRERLHQRDMLLLSKPKVAWSTWTGKTVIKDEEAGK